MIIHAQESDLSHPSQRRNFGLHTRRQSSETDLRARIHSCRQRFHATDHGFVLPSSCPPPRCWASIALTVSCANSTVFRGLVAAVSQQRLITVPLFFFETEEGPALPQDRLRTKGAKDLPQTQRACQASPRSNARGSSSTSRTLSSAPWTPLSSERSAPAIHCTGSFKPGPAAVCQAKQQFSSTH